MARVPEDVELKIKVDATEFQAILDNIHEGFEEIDKRIQKRRKSIVHLWWAWAGTTGLLLGHITTPLF